MVRTRDFGGKSLRTAFGGVKAKKEGALSMSDLGMSWFVDLLN